MVQANPLSGSGGNSRTVNIGKSSEEQESFSKNKRDQVSDSFRKGESPLSKDMQPSKQKKGHGSKDINIGGMQFGPMNSGLGNFKMGGNKPGN